MGAQFGLDSSEPHGHTHRMTEKNTVIVKADLPSELWQRARGAGVTRGMNVSQIVEEALTQWLAAVEDADARARRGGR